MQHPLLPVSWITVIIHRAAIHENRFIKKWGIMLLLTLNLDEVPLLGDDKSRNFTHDTFIMLLKEPTLYMKNHGEGRDEPSLLTKHLLTFFRRCFYALVEAKRKQFFYKLLFSISQFNISHVPLTFITQSLSIVPQFMVFDRELLKVMKNIIRNICSHSFALRAAVKTFLLRTSINFLDPSSIRVSEIMAFYGFFSKEECLCRGSGLWMDVATWLRQNNDQMQKENKDIYS